MGMTIDAQDYEVLVTSEAIGGEGGKRSFLGQSEEAKNRIVVDGTLTESRQEEVLLHELIHIVDTGMPEYLVTNLSTRLYGFLKGNDLLRPGLMERVSDGELAPADMAKFNEMSNQQAEQMEEMGVMMPSTRSVVSEAPWHGQPGELTESDGRYNRAAIHMAARDLLTGRFPLVGTTRKREAHRILSLFRDILQEGVPSGLGYLAR